MLPVRPRPREEIEIGGLWWRIEQPRVSTASRIWDGIVGNLGHRVVTKIVREFFARDPRTARAQDEAAEVESAEWAASRALEILRLAHAGKVVTKADIAGCLAALAPLLSLSDADSIAKWSRDLLWESELACAKSRGGAYAGSDNQLAVARKQGREAWEAMLDKIVPDLRTYKLIQFWAFLFLCRPSVPASTTAP